MSPPLYGSALGKARRGTAGPGRSLFFAVITAVLLTLCMPLAPAGTAAAATVGTVYDFEGGTQQGWTVASGSFGQLISNRAFEHNSATTAYTKQGTWFMSTLETATQAANDGYTGEVDSPSFVLTQPTVNMLVGGGSGATTYVGVLNASGTVLAKAQGANSEKMLRRTLDLSAYVGQTLHLAVVDGSTSGWGHVTLDDVHINEAPPGITYDFEGGTQQGWTVASGSFGQLISNRAFEHNSATTAYTKQGTWFMSTLETATQAANDGYTGEVDSPSFVLTQPTLNMLVGGGNSADTYVGVLDASGTVVAKAQGANSETMFRRILDVSAYVGQTLHLAVVDKSTSSWGHVTLDDVHINEPLSGYQALDFETGTPQGFRVVSGSFGAPLSDRDSRHNAADHPYSKQGAFFLSTLESPTGAANDGYTGQLLGPDFVLSQPTIQMMIGGGSGAGEYVAVETSDNTQVWKGSGANSESMQPRTADLTAYVGKTLHLRVVDQETGAWGSISLDDVQLNLPSAGTTPGAVPDLASTHNSGGSADLQWTFPVGNGVTNYRVYRADQSTSTDTNPTGTATLLATVAATQLQYTDTTATAAGGYIYTVRAVNAAGTEGPPAYTIARAYKDLTARGATKVYSGTALGNIRFPVGPLGDGGLLQDGTGVRRNWQNFYPSDNVTYSAKPLPDTFFAIRSGDTAGGAGTVAALQTTAAGSFPAAPSLTMTGEYPLGSYTFTDPVPGVTVTESFDSPMVPGDTKNSSLPVAAYTFHLTNTSTTTKKLSLLSSQQNAVGWDGTSTISGAGWTGYGGNTNTVETGTAFGTRIQMSRTGNTASMRLSTTAAGTTATASWDTSANLLTAFKADPALDNSTTATSATGKTVDAALSTSVTLAAGASADIPVVLRWWVPTASHQGGLYTGRHYTSVWSSASDLDTYVDAHLADAQALTKSYHDTLYASDLPQYVLDRLSSGAALLHTPTAYWSSGGVFGGYEGYGCCAGMPPHVWEYNQNGPQLFHEVGSSWVSQWLAQIRSDGRLPERPVDQTGGGSAIDGQAGVILSAYREYQSRSATDGKAWLDTQWPNLKLAMDWIWKTYDADRDGLTSGSAHNTLDTDFTGTSSWTGSMYLVAANATSKLAAIEGDTAEATLLGKLYSDGRTAQDKLLWNGQYYREVSGGGGQSYGNGVAIDMLLGQWWSDLLNLGRIYPADREEQSLRTLYRANDKNNFLGVTHQWRTYVMPTDSGMTMISWPHGDRPSNAVNYNDETMSGFEYSAAAAMIQNGLVTQGLSVVNAANDRYDGVKRTAGISTGTCAAGDATGNPFGDDECGQWYSRSGSSWSVLQALQGLAYDGPKETLGFAPVYNASNHQSFFTAGDAWGLFNQQISSTTQKDTLTVTHGPLKLSHLTFTTPTTPTGVTVTVDGAAVTATQRTSGGVTTVDLAGSRSVASGGKVVVTFTS
ncbi:GH116 family glycosyl hydrolase [Kitasatospora sp. NPDC057015]|uniref:GH116 family glycosyl hydrolase n=1 Tax=Kitasatospora sp. NPDC057015 TaxID=3346001 RepID=UPI003638C2E6